MTGIAARQYAGRDVPFRDPIIYPGEPMPSRSGRWHRIHSARVCVRGGEFLRPNTVARFGVDGWECRWHGGFQGSGDTP